MTTANFAYTGRRKALGKFIRGEADGDDLEVVRDVVSEVLENEIEDVLLLEDEDIINKYKEKFNDVLTLVLTPEEPENEKEQADMELGSAEKKIVLHASQIVDQVLKYVLDALEDKTEGKVKKHEVSPRTPDNIAKAVAGHIIPFEQRLKEALNRLHPSIQAYVKEECAKAELIS